MDIFWLAFWLLLAALGAVVAMLVVTYFHLLERP